MQYVDDEYHHVFNRGAHKNRIFYSADNYLHCIRLFNKYSNIYNVSVLCFCLMPNHYHFILRQNKNGSIARFLQTTFNAYTQALNKQRGMRGTLFESRAKGIPVENERHMLQLIRYIHLNPVTAKLVERAGSWKFSDYRNWISSTGDPELRKMFFHDAKEYAIFVEDYHHERDGSAFEISF